MKIIRWFLSHFFLILLIVAVIYGYMFWGNLAGESTPAGKAIAYLSSEFAPVDKFVKAVKAKQAQLSTKQTSAESQQSSASTGESDEHVADNVSDEQSEETTEKPPFTAVSQLNKPPAATRDIAQQPVSITYSHNQMRVTQNSVGQIKSQAEVPAKPEVPVKAQAVKTAVAAASVESGTQITPLSKTSATKAITTNATASKAEPIGERGQAVKSEAPARVVTGRATASDKFVSAKVEQRLNNVDKNGRVINPALKGDAIRDSWVTARKSFYQRRYELSEQSYHEVINSTTDNFDAYGELGNVYFNQGKNAEAAAAYFEAASILVRKGQVGRARSLMGLLKHLDNGRASELQKLIDAAAS